MKAFLFSFTMLACIAGCSHVPRATETQVHGAMQPDAEEEEKIAAFSDSQPGTLPEEWEPLIINRSKKLTEYALTDANGQTVLHARAVSASSGLMQKLDVDPMEESQLSWQWRISRLVETADNYDRTREDAPARIILGFDGNKDDLPFADQIM